MQANDYIGQAHLSARMCHSKPHGSIKAKDNSLLDSDMLAALAPVESYKAESLVLNVGAQDLRDSPSVYPDWVRNQFLALPDSVPERVLALARDLTASEPTPYDRALAIQNYLREYPIHAR